MADLLRALSDHLISAGIARSPSVAGAAPPLFLAPRLGAPAPGEKSPPENDSTAMLSAFLSGGFASRPYESFFRRDTVDIWIRTTTTPRAAGLDRQIRAALIDRRDWNMGGLDLVESEQWRPFQPLGSDNQAFSFVVSYWFDHRVT